MATTSTTPRRRTDAAPVPNESQAPALKPAPRRAEAPACTPARPTHADPQPRATEIKPGATDRGVRHIHDGATHRPTPEQIQQRAYEIWQRRGGGDGNAAVDWLQAERELLGEAERDQGDQ
ncbi:MAG: DUF2934 domain-containing protein [Phycisphaeraceae bacterium]|nr:DUF2934 domain-containing protein [Phycisphaeraceae bacterium]